MSVIFIRLSLNVFAGNKLECISDNKITHIGRLQVIDMYMNCSNRDKT